MVLGAAIGLCFCCPVLFNVPVPFLLLPLQQEFGWNRASISAATVPAMLGMTLASPFTGRLLDRYGPVMLGCAALCLGGELAVGCMGACRYQAATPTR